jgi:NAD(P)-dependent dehydrogenase (short-subunit alcohol dehydrogenase family)
MFKALKVAAGLLGGAIAARSLVQRATDYSFEGRVVLITGGSRGLGLLMARQWAMEGARLAILARDGDELQRAVEDLAARGAETLAIPCDVTDREQLRAAIDRVLQRYDRIDVLVNNAGVIQMGPLDHMSLDDFEESLAVHFWAPLHAMWEVIPHMRVRGEGRIVNISSIGGRIGVPHLVPYCAGKFALTGLSDAMRGELAEDGIKVTTIIPGLMRTGSHLNARFKGRNREEFAWFALLDATPLTSMDARRAARKIVEACRRGDARLTLTIQAKLAVLFDTIAPQLSADLMSLYNKALPPVSISREKESFTGWQSRSPLVPSMLTRLSDRATVENNELNGNPAPI